MSCWLFDYILYSSQLPIGSEVRVFIDSQYVLRFLLGDQLPSIHHQLVELAQQYFTALRTIHFVQLAKVSSHMGVPGNELADVLAKRGVSSFGSIGRFSTAPTTSLSPPEVGYNSDLWLSKTPQEQSDFLVSLLERHRSVIPILLASPKKPWISPGTSLLIYDLQQSTDLSFHEIKQSRKRIKKSAKKDKQEFISSHLQSDFHGSSALQWRTARSIGAPFTPRPVNLYDISGKLTPKHTRPAVFAEYLSAKVWKAPPDLGPIPVDPPPPTDCGSFFSMGELNIVLRSLRTGRSPGPDGIVAEMLKGSPYILKLFLLEHFNHCFSTSTALASRALSEVVMLCNKAQGDTRDLSYYRPISLTITMYKIFASLMQKRLSAFFDDKIRPTQFGFRAHRSTSQLIHIMRRLLESFERQQHPLHLLFLDWSKDFDSVTFESISSALTHFGVPPLFKNAIFSLYSQPKFRVRDSGYTSPVYSQTRGLRQGCPLSRYLSILFLPLYFTRLIFY